MDNIHLKERSKEEGFDVFAHYLKQIEMSSVRGDAIEKAGEVKKKYLEDSGKFPPYTHEDLKNIAKMNGVEKIHYFDEITFGYITKDRESKNRYEIYLPKKEFKEKFENTLIDRGNFTLAHEIGHIFAGDTNSYRCTRQTPNVLRVGGR